VYLLQTLARQLYGDTGNELFHIHAGYKGSAGNGKSKFFEILELVLGEYIHKFAVETLVVKQRSEPHKAVPEFKNWKGKRILYCSEPNPEDKLNSGVLKEMTGGEKISFRLCFSNETHKFVPMYKMHIMCNDTPQIDGGDQGVRRRIRKIDYISRFVDAEEADETRYMYAKDMGFVETFKNDVGARLEFLRYVLRHYDHSYAYSMPDIIKDNSSSYVDEHNSVLQFVKDRVQQENNAFFTLKDAKSIFKSCEYYDSKLNLRSSLEKVLRAQCIDSKRISGVLYRYVFYNYKLIISE
jgi:putative DNA primase/helicase